MNGLKVYMRVGLLILFVLHSWKLGCPPPISSWDQCGLSDRILKLLEKNEMHAPFAIQKQAIPAIMSGRDIIGKGSSECISP